MQATDSFPCCEGKPLTRDITLFGKTVRCKGYVCSADGVSYPVKPDPPRLQLAINITDFCPCSCPFCVASASREKRNFIDLELLEKRLLELKKADIVRGVSFTGGEPFSDVRLLDEAICLVFDIFGLETEISVVTNGFALQRMHELRYLSYLETIHISRHHYNEARNRSLFGAAVPGNAELKEIVNSVSFRDLFVFNCLLLKDQIGTPEEAHRFMDFAAETGVPKTAFITGIPVNDYVRSATLPFEAVLRPDDPSLLFTRGFRDYGFCRCRDGIYISPDGQLEEFYGRATNRRGCDYAYGLVFGTDGHIRCGYGGEMIV